MSGDIDDNQLLPENEEEEGGDDPTNALLESVVSTGFQAVNSSDLFEGSNSVDSASIGVEAFEDNWDNLQDRDRQVSMKDVSGLVPPETGVAAQIVVVITSLGSFRRQFFGSKRTQHFLDCKGLVYHLIDTNRDVSQGIDLKDQEFLEEWDKRKLLASEKDGEKSRFMVPQVLIDGVSIGDGSALQDLEEDGDLDWVAVRAACPACLNERDPGDSQCQYCGVQFFELIPDEIVKRRQIQRFCRGQQYDDTLPTVHHLRYTEAIANLEHQDTEPELLTYETLFGESPPSEE